MRGVYLVAAELARRSWITSPIARNSRGADLLMTANDLTKAYSVEVKTSGKGVFRFSQHAKDIDSRSHIYILVNIKTNKKDGEVIAYYIVPSKILCKLTRPGKLNPRGLVVLVEDVLKYKDKWPRRGVDLPESN
jgi:hypothetical protein